MSLKPLTRYERKWTINNLDKIQLNLLLFRSSFFFSTHFPNRKVNSIYFDDMNFSSVRDNLDGVNTKQKIRVRWYGSKNEINNAKIEIKKKIGFQNNKTIIDLAEVDEMSTKSEIDLKKLEEIINKKIQIKKYLRPTAMTSYEREYYLSNNKLVRATLDYNIQNTILIKNKDSNIIKNYLHLILEMKYDLNLDNYVRKMMNHNTFRLSKNSKYVNSFFMTSAFLS